MPKDRSGYGGFDDVEIRVIRSLAEFRDASPLLAGARLLICLVAYGECSHHLYQVLSRINTPYLLLHDRPVPYENIRNWAHKGLRVLAGDLFWRVLKAGYASTGLQGVRQELRGIKPPDFVVFGGRRSVTTAYPISTKTRPIWAHAMDYDLCLEEKARNAPPTETAVFIDEYRPYHRDLRAMGYKRIVDADVYYAQLRRLFDRIERELGLEVVIAACPRADYSDMPGIFGNRRTVQNVTSRIIADCRLALAHRSTAIGFAVAFGKPVLLIATRENYEHPSQKPYFDGFERALGKPIQSYEDPAAVDLSIAFNIDRDRYDAYMENYVKCKDTPELPYWEIVLGELKAAGVFANRDAGAEGTAGR